MCENVRVFIRCRTTAPTTRHTCRESSVTVVSNGVYVPITLPAGLKAVFWSNASSSICTYSAGLPRPRGSNPRSPIMEPSSQAGASVLGSHSWRSAADPRPGAATDFFAGAALAGVLFLPKEGSDGFLRVRVPFLAMKTFAPLEMADTAAIVEDGEEGVVGRCCVVGCRNLVKMRLWKIEAYGWKFVFQSIMSINLFARGWFKPSFCDLAVHIVLGFLVRPLQGRTIMSFYRFDI